MRNWFLGFYLCTVDVCRGYACAIGFQGNYIICAVDDGKGDYTCAVDVDGKYACAMNFQGFQGNYRCAVNDDEGNTCAMDFYDY